MDKKANYSDTEIENNLKKELEQTETKISEENDKKVYGPFDSVAELMKALND